ncbi:MAG TPA: AAA family ATPase [Phycisphaerae bacterium]|nr:AAA family ATPase [Phycisphaerae bacterium]
MKITKISLQGFRAFDEPFELDLGDGKNLLLHGENGSGKSSLYLAMKRMFEELGDNIAKYRNHFCPDTRTTQVQVHIKGNDAKGAAHDTTFQWDQANGHPIVVPANPAVSPVSATSRSLLADGARRSGFLDYRVMLRTHLFTSPLSRANWGASNHDVIYGADAKGLEAQLFDVMTLAILAGVRVTTAGGRETTIGRLMRNVWQNRPATRHKNRLYNANSHTETFNQAFNAKLPELEAKLAEFLNNFENHQLAVKFQPVNLAWDKPSLMLSGANLIPQVTFRGKAVADYHEFLNEARLSAIAACMFLAGVYLSDNDFNNPAYPRFLVLDDTLIGLELENRLPVLKILKSDAFRHYQIFLFTHDRVWYDLARGYLPVEDGWLHKELLADETTGKLIPRERAFQSSLALAKARMNDGDFPAAAVHARAALEWKLRNVCEKRGVRIKFKKDQKEIKADDLWKGILARQQEREEHQKTHPGSPDFIPAALQRDIEAVRSTVLNQLSHEGALALVRNDVHAAITAVEAFHNHNFPDA